MSVNDMKIIKLAGRSLIHFPIHGTNKNNELSGISKSTPEWMIRMDDILEGHVSSHAGDSKGTQLFGFSYHTERETVGYPVNQLIANAAFRLSDLIVLIQNATYSPILEQYMNNGTLINNIVITRWGWIGASLTQLEQRVFSICYITQFRQILDYVVLFVRYVEVHENIYIYSQTGESMGQTGSKISALTGLSSTDVLDAEASG